MTEGKGDVWVAAGFAELAHSGVDGVRVEVLAKNLGVTKGGFYRRFKDRAALLDAMISSTSWKNQAPASVTAAITAIARAEVSAGLPVAEASDG